MAAFNRFLGSQPAFARSPLVAGIAFARLDRATARTNSVTASTGPEGGRRTVVVMTSSGLLDDSVRAIRYRLVFERSSGAWRLASALKTQRCWPRRGHQRFSPQPCV